VVARDHNAGDLGVGKALEEAISDLLGLGGWVGHLEQVADHDHRVDRKLLGLGQQPVQRVL
jgi:hypothetical protein